MESIIREDTSDKCFMCKKWGSEYNPIELHHIYKGKNRKASDKNGFVVHLCANCHRGTNGVHGKYGHLMDIYLEKTCQIAFEETHTREEFMKIIGCNYLEEDES